jgi:2-C-methyl-D-erythritol 2,4-cyclodiphosphate synthase
MKAAGYAITNVDSTLILAQPKIGPHAEAIREKLTTLLDIPANCIGIKAKTPEGMGTDNAAIAHAAVLLEKKKSSPSKRSTSKPSRSQFKTRR